MAFTYSGDPATSARDALRFTLQDTVEALALFQDAELDYALAEHSDNVNTAAIALCLTLSLRFAQELDRAVDRVSESGTAARAQFYRDLHDTLRARGAVLAGLRIGGRRHSEKEALESNPDAVQPEFKKDQFDVPDREEL